MWVFLPLVLSLALRSCSVTSVFFFIVDDFCSGLHCLRFAMSSPSAKRVQKDASSVFLWDLKDVWPLLVSFLDFTSAKKLRLVAKELSYAPFVSNFVWNLNRIHAHPALVSVIECAKCEVGRTLSSLKLPSRES